MSSSQKRDPVGSQAAKPLAIVSTSPSEPPLVSGVPDPASFQVTSPPSTVNTWS